MRKIMLSINLGIFLLMACVSSNSGQKAKVSYENEPIGSSVERQDTDRQDYDCPKEKRIVNIEDDWKKASSKGTLAAYKNFLSIHPQSKYSEDAKENIEKLERDYLIKNKLKKVVIMGRIIDDNGYFGNCPSNIVVNIINKIGKRSRNSEQFLIYENAVSNILYVPTGSFSINNDKEINGFQKIVDENGYFYICDLVSIDSKKTVNYLFDRYIYMEKCDIPHIDVIWKNVGLKIKRDKIHNDGKILKIYLPEVKRTKNGTTDILFNTKDVENDVVFSKDSYGYTDYFKQIECEFD